MSIVFDHFILNGVNVVGTPTPNSITFTITGPTTVTSIYAWIAALIAAWPSSPQVAGASLTLTFTFSNHGEDGSFTFTLRNGSTVLGSTVVSAASGTTGNAGRIDFTMPSGDANLSLSSYYGGDATETVQLLQPVATSLTLSLPTSIPRNATVNFSGKLSRADAGVTGVQPIKIISGSTVYATVNTDVGGNYNGAFVAPNISGNYVFQASFEGSGLLSASLSYK